ASSTTARSPTSPRCSSTRGAFPGRRGPGASSTQVWNWRAISRSDAGARRARSPMPERAFYDTVIFALSINPADGDHVHCRALLDVDSGTITWCLVLSVITRGEATLHEYLDQLEQRCAMQGVEWLEVRQEEI